MARKLDRFPTELLSRTTSTYPWDEWLDGSVWELEAGKDFTIKAKSLRTTGQQVARARGGKLRVADLPNGNLVIQFLNTPAAPRKQTSVRTNGDSDRTKQIRAWAKEHGWPDLGEYGRLPADVLQAFDRAESHPHGGTVTQLPPRD